MGHLPSFFVAFVLRAGLRVWLFLGELFAGLAEVASEDLAGLFSVSACRPRSL